MLKQWLLPDVAMLLGVLLLLLATILLSLQ